MSNRKKTGPDSVDMKEFEDYVRRLRDRIKDGFGPPMENEPDSPFGSPDLLFKSDSELFPSDITEYRPEVKKLRLVKTSSRSKQADDNKAEE
ncbi:hypothetical protein [Hahella sp. NBU794]|uniref:hypothetical protein n=1 Tax=Hahella sp. NBU794 TaxID=3422590 RepID=UPI003D6F23B5